MKTLMIFCFLALIIFIASGCLVFDLATGSTYPQRIESCRKNVPGAIDDCIFQASKAGLGTIKARTAIPFTWSTPGPKFGRQLEEVYEMDPAQKKFMEECLRLKGYSTGGPIRWW